MTQPSPSRRAPSPASPTASDTPAVGSFVGTDTSVIAGGKSASQASVSLPLARLKHYRLVELIGRGGMGDVYRAHDEMFQREVAIKVLPADLASDEQFVRRFQREAKAIAGLSHPNIVPVYGIDRDHEHFFYAMQFVAGESLDQRFRREKKLPLQEALRIAIACLSALEAAHARGLVHRDVKPGNVLLQEHTDHVFLVDFGLVRRVDDQSLLTVTGMVMGTVDYMAPEQARGRKDIDLRADLYSVGAMLYHLLSGRLPFNAHSFSDMLYCHAYESPIPLAECAPDLPLEIVELIERLMAKKPDDRPANCRAVIEAIAPLQTSRFRTQRVAEQIQEVSQATPSQAYAELPEAYGGWQRISDRAASLIRQRSPQWLQHWQSIERQVDSEVERSQRNCQRLQALQREGQQLLVELQQQRSEAPTSDQPLDDQIAQLTEQLAQLDLQVAQADSQHAQLINRRAALAARLAMTAPRKSRPSAKIAFLSAGGAGALGLIWLAVFLTSGSEVPPPEPPPPDFVVGRWYDLMPYIDPARDAVTGQWIRQADGSLLATGGNTSGGHARLQIPVFPQGSFELQASISRRDSKSDANLVFPTGAYNARATFGHTKEGCLPSHPPSGEVPLGIENAVPPMPVGGPPSEVRVVVQPQQERVAIEIYVNGKITCDWTGLSAEVANNAPCQIPNPQALGLTISNRDVIYHSLQLKMLSGHADVRLPAPSEVRLDLGLVAHYPFNEGQGLAAHDPAGKYDGRLTGAKWTKGFDDGALYFDGKDYVLIPQPLLNRQPNYTFTAWVRDEGSPGQFHIYADYSGDWINSSIRLEKKAILHTAIWTPTAWRGHSTPAGSVAPGKWQFIAARFTATDAKDGMMTVWIDGQSYQYPLPILDANHANSARLGLGGRGSIEDVRIYHRSLGDAEVEAVRQLQAEKAAAANAASSSELSAPLEAFTAKVPATPNDAEAYRQRSRWFAVRQQWPDYRRDMEAFLKLKGSDTSERAMLATACLYLEDQAAYEAHFADLRKDLAGDSQAWSVWEVVRTLLLNPRSQAADLQIAESKIEKQLAVDPQHNAVRWRPVMLYRLGKWQACIDASDSYVGPKPTMPYHALPLMFKAMALKKLDKASEAEKALQDAKEFFERCTLESTNYGPGQSLELRQWWWSTDGMHAQIAYHEASELILKERRELKIAPGIDPRWDGSAKVLKSPESKPSHVPVDSKFPPGYQDGKQDFALSFDGAAHVDLPLWYDGLHPISIEAFVTPAARENVGTVIANFHLAGLGIDASGTPLRWQMVANDGVGADRGYQKAIADHPFQVLQRVHVAGVRDGTRLRLYIDGKLQTYAATLRGFKNIALPFFIGADPNPSCTPEHFFHGVIDEVRISRSVRYTEDFTPTKRFTTDADTLALYHFDEGAGNRLNDSSGNGYHGTIQKAKWVRADAVPVEMIALSTWQEQGRAHWRAGDLKQSRQAYEQLIEQSPTSYYEYAELAVLCLALGDEKAFREHCQALLARADQIGNPRDRVHVLRLFCLVPDVDPELAAKLRVDFTADADTEWVQRTHVLWRYRQGQWQDTIAKADAYNGKYTALPLIKAQCLLVRAMAHWQLGDRDKAREALESAEHFAGQPVSESTTAWAAVPNQLYAQIIYREATKLIRGESQDWVWPTGATSAIPPAKTLPQVAAIEAHQKSISAVVVAPIAGVVITGGVDATVHLWDLKQHKHLLKLTEARADIGALGVSPDNRWLAIGTTKGEVELWNLPERRLHRRWNNAGGFVRCLVFSPDNKQLYIAGKHISVWNISAAATTIRTVVERGAFDLAITKDGQTLIAGEPNGKVAVFSVAGEIKREFSTGGILHGIDLSPDEKQLLTFGGAGWNDRLPGLVQIWDWSSGARVKSFVGHHGFASDGEFTPDGKQVVTGGRNDRTLRVWNVETQQEVARVESKSHCFAFLTVEPSGQYVISGGGTHYEFGKYEDDGDNRLYFWDLSPTR